MKLLLWKLGKITLYIVLFFILFVLLYFCFYWILSSLTTSPKAACSEPKQTIYASTNGVHMDLIFHRDLLSPQLLAELEIETNDEYIAIGWGDKGFYLDTPTWAELKISTAINAGFLLSETVMHVTHYAALSDKWYPILICPTGLDDMKKFIFDSFSRNAEGKIQKIDGEGYTSQDFFYKAVGSYTCFYTCNIWVNQALKKGQIKTAIWSPFDKGIIKHL